MNLVEDIGWHRDLVCKLTNSSAGAPLAAVGSRVLASATKDILGEKVCGYWLAVS